jgi:heat shock protein HslJ
MSTNRLTVGLLFSFLLLFHFCEAGPHKKIYVNDRKIACAGNFECMQIKEKAKKDWQITTDTIAGFNYQEGYTYTLSVEITEPKNSYAGNLNDKYKLVKIISKTKTSYNPAEKLENKTWHLKSLTGARVTMSERDTVVYIRLNIKTGKINGRGICNNFVGSLKTDGNSITFENLAFTKMMCDGIAFEKTLSEFLVAAKSYTLEENKLTLFCSGNRELVFTAQ